MRFNRAAVALSVGSAAAVPVWQAFAFPTLTLPGFTLPTALPTLNLPTFPGLTLPTGLPTLPGFTIPGAATTTAKTSHVTSSTTAKVTASGSNVGSSIASTGTGKSSGSVGAVTTGTVKTSPAGTSVPTISKPATGVTSLSTSVSKAPSVSGSAVSKRPSSTGASTGSSSVPTAGIGAPVNTTSGVVTGHLAPNTSGVSEYLGIRFGQAPVGNLRFAAPVAYTSTEAIDGSNFGFDCPCVHENVPEALGPRLYNLLGDLAQINDTLGEDCLFLNVWSKPQTGPKLKPVLVWIYGGGFSFGGTNSLVYNPKHFVDDEEVVAVSLNYRTNVFGFSGAPGITQNTGLLDQRLALEWVRDNIVS